MRSRGLGAAGSSAAFVFLLDVFLSAAESAGQKASSPQSNQDVDKVFTCGTSGTWSKCHPTREPAAMRSCPRHAVCGTPRK